jgi:hypothetical protein
MGDHTAWDCGKPPSACTQEYWHIAEREEGGPYPESTVRGGKWLIFVPSSHVDDAWATIKTAIEKGKLGQSAKVATAKPNPNAQNPNVKVICVYTYDCDDREDVMRIRQALRDLGFTAKMSYKTDDATYKGLYAITGSKRISLYYE